MTSIVSQTMRVLQWGRAPEGAERPYCTTYFSAPTWLQWGRAPEGAESLMEMVATRKGEECFNGAAPRRARRESGT